MCVFEGRNLGDNNQSIGTFTFKLQREAAEILNECFTW